MTLAGWLDLVWYLAIAATGVLLCQLVVQKLVRIYPFLFGYFLVDATQDILLLCLTRNTLPYFYVYVGGQVLKLASAVLVVVELYRVALEGRAALAEFGRRAATYVVLALAAVAVVGLLFGPPVPPGRDPRIHYFLGFERTMDSVLVALLLVIGAFLAWFPIRIRRNAAIYIGGFTAYFLSKWASVLSINTWPTLTSVINVAQLSFLLLCLLAFILLMRREGETETVVTGHRWNPNEMDRLSGQLDAINARLMRIQ